jgi:hypothetical protein
MKHHPLPQALRLALLSLCLAAPMGAKAKTPAPPPLQCEKDGRLQACGDQPDVAKPSKGDTFKAQATDMNGDTAKPAKKKKKGKKTAKKKTKPSVAE